MQKGCYHEKYAKQDNRLIHIVPERSDLGIGGCWNAGVDSELCGKFAIQLDSDDMYYDENTVQKFIDAFYEQNCAMLVGSFTDWARLEALARRSAWFGSVAWIRTP